MVFIEEPLSHSKTERHTYKRNEYPIGLADTQYPTVAMPIPLPLSLPLRQTKRQRCKCFRSFKVFILFTLVHEVVDRHQGLLEHFLVHFEAVAGHAIVADLDEAVHS